MEINNTGGNNVEEVSEVLEVQNARKRKNPFLQQRQKDEKERRQKKKARIIVRNISYKAKEEDIRNHFSQWGTIEEINILKKPDGKLVGCAFIQFETINQATKGILKGNNSKILGRVVFVDWALGKNEYTAQQKENEPEEKKPRIEIKLEDEIMESGLLNEINTSIEEDEAVKDETDSEEDTSSEEENAVNRKESSEIDNNDNEEDDNDEKDEDDDEIEEDEKEGKLKKTIEKVKKEKHISNDVVEGCTVFIKNIPFDAEDNDLRKVCRKYGPVWYAIINREPISGHSKGTAFVKFKTKESADLCLQAGTEFTLMEEVLDPHPALSRNEITQKKNNELKKEENKDSRNLYLAREGLIMTGSKAAEGVSASDMNKRHKLEQIKVQVLKNLNRFVSRNRLSVHNLPVSYDNEKLKQMAITYTGFRPHECRVMRENKTTPEHPQGKSKGFGFLSFNTHKEALIALRKLNNNPKIFGPQHRPIVAFSIEDRAVHKIKEKRKEKSKINNPTYQIKVQQKKQKSLGKTKKIPSILQTDNKKALKQHIKQLEASRADKGKPNNKISVEINENYVGTAAKVGATKGLRSFKKIKEQSQEHMKKVKQNKRKERQKKIRQMHLAEKKQVDRTKQNRKFDRDDLKHLVNKYKKMIDEGAATNSVNLNSTLKGDVKVKKPKRTKWYQD